MGEEERMGREETAGLYDTGKREAVRLRLWRL